MAVSEKEFNKVVFGGKVWYYKNVLKVNKDGKSESALVELYDRDMRLVNAFFTADELMDFLLSEADKARKLTREELQRNFMQRMQELKGDLSDAEFAGLLEMKYDSLYQYMTGRRFPNVHALCQIADKCGVSIDWLVGRA
ncbi:MAG: hypothetical protein II659_08195 [Bacteroidales bacterium]|nr:hypothetical protein [Bacteroidales bacterium]